MKSNFRTVVILSLASSICGAISAAQEPTPYRLTLRDAIQKALQANLNVLVADTRVEEAEGARIRRLSAALLPQVRAQSYANLQNRSLSAFGISLPILPEVVGPFSITIFASMRSRTSSIFRVIADGRPASEHLTPAKWITRTLAISSSVPLPASISTPSLPRRESMLPNPG